MDGGQIKNNVKLVVDNSEESFSENEKLDEDKLNSDSDESEFTKQCEFLLEKITKNYKDQRDEIRNLVKLHKKELKNIKKVKRSRGNKDKTGFTKPTIVPDKLANFVGLAKGSEISRTELTGLLCKEFKKRNLYYKKDRRIIIPDDDVKKIFNLPKDAEKSTNPKDKNGLNFYNLQKYIAECYNDFNNNTNNTNNTNNNFSKSKIL